MTDAIEQAKQENFQQWKAAQTVSCPTLEELHELFKKWLYLEPQDTEFIEVTIAALLDREIPGDPVWLYAIAPPGGVKSELLRTFRVYPKAYTLDTLTPSTFVSGKAEKNKETDEYEPIAGILQDLDGKTVVVKDFTTILNSSKEAKTEIYGQLRSIYDGFFEKAFGTMRRKVSVESTIGLVVGVTYVIDKYTQAQSSLGERFLKIRSNPNKWNAAERALKNGGQEIFMRIELGNAVKTFIESRDFTKIPEIPLEFNEEILKMAMYTAFLRANVWKTYSDTGRLEDIEVFGAEVPTRLAKQFKHLVKLLAIIRGHKAVTEDDLKTLGRVARDTAEPRKQAIVDFIVKLDIDHSYNTSDIAGAVKGIRRANVRNHLEVLEALDCFESDEKGNYCILEHFKDYAKAVYRLPPEALQKKPKKGLFRNGGEGSDTKSFDARSIPGKLEWILGHISVDACQPNELADRAGITVQEMDKLLALLERDRRAFCVHGGLWRAS